MRDTEADSDDGGEAFDNDSGAGGDDSSLLLIGHDDGHRLRIVGSASSIRRLASTLQQIGESEPAAESTIVTAGIDRNGRIDSIEVVVLRSAGKVLNYASRADHTPADHSPSAGGSIVGYGCLTVFLAAALFLLVGALSLAQELISLLK